MSQRNPFEEEQVKSGGRLSQAVKDELRGSVTEGTISPGPHRISSFVFLNSLRSLVYVVGVLVLSHFVEVRALHVLVVVGLVGIARDVITYFTFTWELGEHELIFSEGLFNKRNSRIPYSKIHGVDIEMTAVQRILGFAKLSFQTAGAIAGNSPDSISPLRLQEAEILKAQLYSLSRASRKRTGSVAGTEASEIQPAADGAGAALPSGATLSDTTSAAYEVQAEQDTPVFGSHNAGNKLGSKIEGLRGVFAGGDYEEGAKLLFTRRLSHKERLLIAIQNASFLAFLLIFPAVLSRIDNFLSFFNIDVDSYVANYIDEAIAQQNIDYGQVLSSILWDYWILAVLGILLSVLLSYLVTGAYQYLKYSSYELKTYEDRIELTLGIFSKSTKTIKLKRVQQLVVEQGLIYKLIGYARVSVCSYSSNIEELGETEIFPCVKLSQVPALIGRSFPDFAAYDTIEAHKLPGFALRRELIRASLYLLVWAALGAGVYVFARVFLTEEVGAHLVSMIGISILLLLLIPTILLYARAVLYACRSRLGQNGKHIYIYEGGITDTLRLSSKDKLQQSIYKQTPFDKRLKVGTLSFSFPSMASGKMRHVAYQQAHEFLGNPSYDAALHRQALSYLAEEGVLYPQEEAELENLQAADKPLPSPLEASSGSAQFGSLPQV